MPRETHGNPSVLLLDPLLLSLTFGLLQNHSKTGFTNLPLDNDIWFSLFCEEVAPSYFLFLKKSYLSLLELLTDFNSNFYILTASFCRKEFDLAISTRTSLASRLDSILFIFLKYHSDYSP